ncbi:MAG: hypothetical protein H6732_02260 [Alphaproteobacteria bacterium]|nr:hypothetical protein [Alphaproteobacteria bacterium]
MRLLLPTVLLLVASACFGPTKAPLEPTDVVRAAAIANDLKAEPRAVDAVLARHGVTRDQVEAALYAIASDPDLAQKYASLRK